MGSHMNSELQTDFNNFGEDNFVFEVLDYLKLKEDPAYNYSEDLQTLEFHWLEKNQLYGEKGYNKVNNTN
jgi:hypothetical protein